MSNLVLRKHGEDDFFIPATTPNIEHEGVAGYIETVVTFHIKDLELFTSLYVKCSNITLEDLEIPEVCPVLGIPLKSWGENNIGGYKEDSPSIDKFIPELGYVKGNITIISFKANLLKRDGTLEEIEKLYEWMKRTTDEMKNNSLLN